MYVTDEDLREIHDTAISAFQAPPPSGPGGDEQPGEDWFLENTVPLPAYRPERLL